MNTLQSAELSPHWTTRPYHRSWLMQQANGLFDFFQPRMLNPRGGFYELSREGAPLLEQSRIRPIHLAARAVHIFTIGHLLGQPGCSAMIDHGMNFLWNRHRDAKNGGYFWSVDDTGPADSNKQAYGHAFVLLAASSALLVGHPLARPMLDDITQILNTRFWEPQHGAVTEEFDARWTPLDGGRYRGQNSNMHLTEALMAAFEATGENDYLAKAKRIADLIIGRAAASNGWRVPEHFKSDWTVDRTYYHPNEMFRPAGTTPGHAMEWARLILQLWVLDGRKSEWQVEAARELFGEAMLSGWDKKAGGLFYTLNWDNTPDKRMKLWWPMCEGVGAAHFLNELAPDLSHEAGYRTIWNVLAQHYIDHEHGGWHEEKTEDLKPSYSLFSGKADIYHTLQACLIPLYPAAGSLTAVIRAQA